MADLAAVLCIPCLLGDPQLRLVSAGVSSNDTAKTAIA